MQMELQSLLSQADEHFDRRHRSCVQLLRALPVHWSSLEASDLPNTVFYNCQKASKDVRAAATSLTLHWVRISSQTGPGWDVLKSAKQAARAVRAVTMQA